LLNIHILKDRGDVAANSYPMLRGAAHLDVSERRVGLEEDGISEIAVARR